MWGRSYRGVMGMAGLVVAMAMPVAAQDVSAFQTVELRAWERSDTFVPPDYEGYFPDDPAGGKALDALYPIMRKAREGDPTWLPVVRQGLRQTREHRTLILSLVGNHFIWNEDPQNAEAIELMYHAFGSPDVINVGHYAMYFGLSVTRPKTPNILRALAHTAITTDHWSFEVSRIRWGCRDQMEQLLTVVGAYERSDDPRTREAARKFAAYLKDERFDYRGWKKARQRDEMRIKHADTIARLRDQLLAGDSKVRAAAAGMIASDRDLGLAMSEAMLPAWAAAATDPDVQVRRQVATQVGTWWLAGQADAPEAAVQMVMALTGDPDRKVRYQAIYFGLSDYRSKDEPVIRRMIETGLDEPYYDPNLHGRITWGLRGHKDQASAILSGYLAQVKTTDPIRAMIGLHMYREIAGEPWSGASRFGSPEALQRKAIELMQKLPPSQR